MSLTKGPMGCHPKNMPLDQDKLTAYVHAHPFHTILGDINFGEDGDWTEAKIVFEQFHDVKGNDVDQFRGGKAETILEPALPILPSISTMVWPA